MFSLLIFALLQLQPMQMLREDPDRAGVNTHPYEFKEMQVTPALRGINLCISVITDAMAPGRTGALTSTLM